MNVRLAPTLIFVALLCGAHRAHAEVGGSARVTALTGIDTNARRDYESSLNGIDAVGNLIVDLSGDYQGETTAARADYSAGGRKFIRFPSEDVLVQAAALEGGVALSQSLGVGLLGAGKDRRGADRDYTDLSASAYVDFYPDDALSLRARGGAHRFIYRPNFAYSYSGPEAGVSLSWRFNKQHSAFGFGDYSDRTFNGNRRFDDGSFSETERRHDNAISAGAGYEYRGRFRVRAEYAYSDQPSNSFGETTQRHRVNALFATRLFWKINLIAQGTLQLTRYPDGVFLSPEIILVQDEENSNSLAIRLVRPITESLDVELRYAIYQYRLPTNGLEYLRQVGFAGISWRI